MERETIEAKAVRAMVHLDSKGVETVHTHYLANRIASGNEMLVAETIIRQMADSDEAPISAALDGEGVELAADVEEIKGWLRSYVESRE